MRGRALACAIVVGCARPAPPIVDNRAAPDPRLGPGPLRDRPRWHAVALPAPEAARLFARPAPPPGSCGHDLLAAWRRGPEALLVHGAELAATGSVCAAAAAPVVARVALVLDRDGAPAAASAWRVAAALATTPGHRRAALRNAAEATWREAAARGTPAAWRGAARAFADATTAGDRDATAAELDAWHNALVLAAARCGDPLSIIPAARTRAAQLGAAGHALADEAARTCRP